ncbi:unnamed protein product [Brassicogethes aeneus]|uniref:Cytosolic endo-beta-N-acetylglucosaminidase TIM barrel domain-containing protein n=1 Tax=Brassicogethes aeneus TaxID=1431903 RepID=A0A9P0BI63_BRAAE|nr:unnamed protein product [Brassicogethes aeneus]
MEPTLAMNSNEHCFPIVDLNVIEEILNNPPSWVHRIKPRVKRSCSVVENTLSDCHIPQEHFKVRKRLDKRMVPKTLICHDYKGGYREDRYLHDENSEIIGNSYTFYNWTQIDIFVYFSHHFITIPPVCWINAAHKHGVKVLGTLITEFNPGKALCKSIFKDLPSVVAFAKSLAAITRIFRFDGWLLNIENPVEEIDLLKTFVNTLTGYMHADNPESLVIWYDSVINDGKLAWQNELNSNNIDFFESCDGIFLNYVWTEEKIIKSLSLAGQRNFDIYVGIDVFGRNTFGGGNFNCFKAAEKIRQYNLSMAIFAPGWTHETLKPEDGPFFETFVNRDTAFWKSLAPYLYTHPTNTVFETDFHIGLDKNHFNIFKQQHQLSYNSYPEFLAMIDKSAEILPLKNACDCVTTTVSNDAKAYRISTKNLSKNNAYVHRLFTCDLKIRDNSYVYFVAKPAEGFEAARMSLLLLTTSNGSFRKVKLLGVPQKNCAKNSTLVEINPIVDEATKFKIAGRHAGLLRRHNCHLSAYSLSMPACDILEIGAIVENGPSILLYAFGVKSGPQLY